jgi:hypothetical protein
MASWRETTSEQVQADLDGLVDAALSTAEQALTAEGEFLPFAVARTLEGDDQLVGVIEDGQPDPQTLIARLWDSLEQNRVDFRAAGVVSDRRYDGRDQVAVQVEHIDGPALEVTLGYRLDSGRFEPQEMSAGEGTHRVW